METSYHQQKETTMTEIMNIKKFSELIGFSPATISRAFTNRARVNDKTAEKILNLAKKYKYRPNRASAASFGNATCSVGVILYKLSNSYFIDINQSIQDSLFEQGYLSIFLSIGKNKLLPLLQRLIDHRVDGLIMVDFRYFLSQDERFEIERMKLPVVMIEPRYQISENWVNTDDLAGGRMVAEYLLKLGHKKFAFCWDQRYSMQREEGFIAKVIDSAADVIVCRGDKCLEKLRQVMATPERPTAIFVGDDDLAIDVYALLRDLHLSIPKDVSVLGYADLIAAKGLYPALTTVRQDGATVGRIATELLLQLLSNPEQLEISNPSQILVPVELIVRASCGVANK